MLSRRSVLHICVIFAFLLNLMVTVSPTGVTPASAQTTTCPCSIWPGPVTPGFAYDNPNPIEMGLKFRSDVPGNVTAVRFFKAVGATGTHIGRLWSMSGVKLAEVTFTNETDSGWQTAYFPTPVAIEPNTTYIISYYVGDGNRRFSDTFDYFASSGVDNGPLHALMAGVDGPNGVFSDTGGFFNQSYRSSNYWVDLIFDDTPDTTPPAITAFTPADGAAGVTAMTNVTVTFDEPIDSASLTGNFELLDALNAAVPAAVSYNAATRTATLDPTNPLAFSAVYTAVVRGGESGVKDRAGNPLAADVTWSFTVEDADLTPPTVVSVSPGSGAVEVAPSANVTATFSEPLDAASVSTTSFVLRDPYSAPVPAVVTYDPATSTATLNPDAPLNLGSTYTAVLLGGSEGIKDLAGNPLAADYNWIFAVTAPPAITAVKPINGASRLRLATNATAYFSRAMAPASVNANTFELLDSAGQPVAAVVTYNPADFSATLDPTADLAYDTTYTARVKSGPEGVKDSNGIPLNVDYTWTFSTLAQRPPVDQGPGGPILVIASPTNLFTRYYAEILRTEGFNEFTVMDISEVTGAVLLDYDLAILGEMSLTPEQATLLSDWVEVGGGNLIAMRPDPDLAPLLGITPAGTTLSDAYLLIDTTQSPGAGIVGQTLQFHGTADQYTLNGATALATLYSDLTTATPYPAVTLRSVGSAGGSAAAFAFDLARSIVYTHQGNPAWQIGHVNPLQSYGTALDLFYGGSQPHWIDFARISIPQADEQQRFFANLILGMNADKKPLPRFWYFPSGEKAAIILTGDDHWGRATPSGSTQQFFDRHISQSPAGCSVEDWECVRSSSYGYAGALLTDAQAAAYTAQGFEFGVHADAGLASGGGWCGTWPSDMPAKYAEQFEALYTKYASIPVQASERSHCYTWFGYTGAPGWNGYAGTPEVEDDLGIRLDTNISYNPASWASVNPGYQMGSGMMMRFAQVNLAGEMTAFLDIYNAGTQMNDDNGQGAAAMRTIVDSYLDAALGPQGYYGGFVVNMHSDNWYGWSYAGSDQIVASAQAHGVPVVSGRQMVDWLDGRNSSFFSAITWDGTTLSFNVTAAPGARNLRGMLPTHVGTVPLSTITRDGSVIPFTVETIKGIEYAFFPALTGAYTALYAPDTTAPVISAVSAVPEAGGSATITWTTDEPATSRVEYGLDPAGLTQSVEAADFVTAHTLSLTGLSPYTTYYYRVVSTDESGNTAIYPDTLPLTFTTPSAAFIDDTAADFNAGTPGAGIYISQIADGEVMLQPAVVAEFSGSALPSGWFSTSGASVVVSGGWLTLDGGNVGTSTFYSPGRAVEAVATFQPVRFQHIGFGNNLSGGAGDSWAIISTGFDGAGLYARTWNGSGSYTSETSTAIPGNFFGAPHRYRVEWGANTVEYYVDGNLVATHNLAVTNPMRPMISDSLIGAPTLMVDWLQMSPYAGEGSYYSRVFDAAGEVTSGSLAWNGTTPAGTSLGLFLRTGNTPVPDATWTAFAPIASGGEIGSGFRFFQYRADLASGGLHSPALEDVTILYNQIADTTPPVITARSPEVDAANVPTDVVIMVEFNEPMNAASITGETFRLRAEGAAEDVSAVVSYSGLTATLTPTGPLAFNTRYHVTVSGGVTDASGNPLGADVVWAFTTTAAAGFVDDTVADFAAGTPDAGTYLAQTANGEVILAPTAGAEFAGSALPAGWFSTTFTPGGTATLASGQLTLDGARVGTDATFGPGLSLEGVVTFNAARFQHFGFGVTYMVDGTPWAIISTGQNGDGLYARTYTGVGDWQAETRTPIPGSYFGAPHRYRIDWLADRFEYYVDGVLVATHNIAVATPMRPMPADSDAGGPTLVVDWMRMSPYAARGVFTSRVFDAGMTFNWQTLTWTGDLPGAASISFETRTGAASSPDDSWAAWLPLNGEAIASAPNRYMQYRATLASTDAYQTPVLASVSINGAVNRAPTAADDAYATAEDAALTIPAPGVLGNDSDPDGDLLTALLVSGPAHGALTLNSDGSFTYTPETDWNGSDSFTYQANDGSVDSNLATVAITVVPVNDSPVAASDAYSTDEDTALAVAAPGVLGNDADLDGEVLIAEIQTAPAHGALTLNSDGSFTYAPAANWYGTETFVYRACDPQAACATAAVTLTVNAVNDAPVAVDDSYTTGGPTLAVSAPGVLGNDSDVENNPLNALLVAGPAHGALTLNSDGSFIYIPAAGYSGADSFTYQAHDGTAASNTATVTITVEVDTGLIFADDFESGSLNAWSGQVTDQGDLYVSPEAALTGSFGLAANLDDNNPIYLIDQSPQNERTYRAKFQFDPNSIGMAQGDRHDLLHMYSGSGALILLVDFRMNNGVYGMRLKYLTDASGWAYTSWFSITDVSHTIEVSWKAASAAGANDGELIFLIDGVEKSKSTTLDTDTLNVDQVRLGAVAAVDAGTRGVYYFDHFESFRDGSVPPLPIVADFSAAPRQGFVPLSVTFTNLSTPTSRITSYYWDFGDGNHSTETNPTHVYTIPGTYTVTLTAYGAGEQDSESKDAYIVVADEVLTQAIFTDGFESGGMTAWSVSKTDGGDLSVSTAAALQGVYGLAALVDDRISMYVMDDRPAAETNYHARFLFDPNGLGMANGDTFTLYVGYAGASTNQIDIEVRYTSGYFLRARVRNDAGLWTETPWVPITDDSHQVAFDWRAASSVGANNGSLAFSVDGVQQAVLDGIDNDTLRVDRVRLGAVGNLDAGTLGTFYLDAFESWREVTAP